MEEINKNISAKLKGLRAEKGYSLEEMASKLGIHRETLRKYENHPEFIEIGLLLQMLNIYDVTTVYFFELIYGKMPKMEETEA